MDVSTIIWSLRIAVGIGIGVYVANHWKEGLRGIVIRCIPVKHRISERSYILQTRITTVVGIVFALLIAIGFNSLLSYGLQQVGWRTPTQQQSASPQLIPIPVSSVRPLQIEESTRIPTKPIKKIQQSIPDLSEEPPTQPVVSPAPVAVRTQPATMYTPTPRKRYQPIAIPCYLQINAFYTIEKAQNQQARWIRQTPYPARVGFVATDMAPYKVVLGPLPSRPAAKQLQQQLTVRSFIRPAEGLQFLTR